MFNKNATKKCIKSNSEERNMCAANYNYETDIVSIIDSAIDIVNNGILIKPFV